MTLDKKFLGLMIAACMVQSPASAASMFMLQFGSYQSIEEAQSHLAEVKSKHAGALSRLEASVRPVTLPPDNLVVYRTQAGPLATRADAQSVCSQLVSNGDSCYIVETAMSNIAKSPASVASSAPVIAETTKAVEASTSPTANTLLKETTSALPVRDDKNIAALNTVTSASAESRSPAADVVDANISPLENFSATTTTKALDEAGKKQALAEASVPDALPASPKRSFWQRINPFSRADDAVSPAIPPAELPVVDTAVDTIISTPSLPPPAVEAPTKADSIVLKSPAPAIDETATKQQQLAMIAAAPVVPLTRSDPSIRLPSSATNSNPILKETPYPLPPPPAPLAGRSSNNINAAGESVVSLPLPTGTLPNANVRVEEAKRVPLTQSNSAVSALPAYPSADMIASNPVSAPAPLVDLSPSSTLGQRTIWAQIGTFATAQDALAFWNQYRQNHPDFPVVRVRVTTPLAAQRRDIAVANLRVGPFAKENFVGNLCASLNPQQHFTCGAIIDVGIAVNPNTSNRSGTLSSSRYQR